MNSIKNILLLTLTVYLSAAHAQLNKTWHHTSFTDSGSSHGSLRPADVVQESADSSLAKSTLVLNIVNFTKDMNRVLVIIDNRDIIECKDSALVFISLPSGPHFIIGEFANNYRIGKYSFKPGDTVFLSVCEAPVTNGFFKYFEFKQTEKYLFNEMKLVAPHQLRADYGDGTIRIDDEQFNSFVSRFNKGETIIHKDRPLIPEEHCAILQFFLIADIGFFGSNSGWSLPSRDGTTYIQQSLDHGWSTYFGIHSGFSNGIAIFNLGVSTSSYSDAFTYALYGDKTVNFFDIATINVPIIFQLRFARNAILSPFIETGIVPVFIRKAVLFRGDKNDERTDITESLNSPFLEACLGGGISANFGAFRYIVGVQYGFAFNNIIKSSVSPYYSRPKYTPKYWLFGFNLSYEFFRKVVSTKPNNNNSNQQNPNDFYTPFPY